MPPFLLIFLSFLFAKAVLLAIIIGTTFVNKFSIPPVYHPPVWPFGYDSSSSVFLPINNSSIIGRVIEGLFRWDTVYFISLADRREYVWEQEWAFGPGWPYLIQFTVPSIH